MREFTVISIFSGCGGSSLGYRTAGGKVLLAVEWDDNAAETYRLNFPDTPIYHGDIGKLSVEEILERTGLQPQELDLFDGSPPCQGFSLAGRRSMRDDRNQLFREYVRLLRGLQPKVFVMENVAGMVRGNMRFIFTEILKELQASGYKVKARVMNAKFFGVPQSRERIIFIGVRTDLGILPSHPVGSAKVISAASSLKDVSFDPDEHAMLLAAGKKYAAYASWPLLKPGGKRTDLGVKNGYSCVKVFPDRPCPTVTKNDGNLTMHGLMHWSEQRRFTVAEYKRFQSFPDSFRFAGSYKDAVQRIGNSVPPLFMQRIAEHIRNRILCQRND
ncbi:MAG TPA: DNA cytosine methyltransferase [Candidatus Kapabacteria bacterium]|jgi:DNA (cytosine-5)-methyltransferase 1